MLTIYQVYLTEFKRSDFDAELYAAKTRKLIRECSKLKSFLGHLPEIAIDERYLENLRFSKMSGGDKAEKIIRDIETIIRREEARNPAYVDLDVRLQELIERKQDLNADIEQILLDLEKLYGEVDEVGNLPKRMGFEDRGRYDLFLEIKHATGAAFDETKARQFVYVLVAGPARRSAAGHVHIGVGRNGEVLDFNRFRNQLFHQKVREFWPDMVVVLDSQTAPGPSGNCWFQRPRRRHNDDKWRGYQNRQAHRHVQGAHAGDRATGLYARRQDTCIG